jgi:hypothetical protein
MRGRVCEDPVNEAASQPAMETSNTIPFLLSMMITDETHFILCAFIFFFYGVGICDVNEPFRFFPLKLGKNQLIA